MGTYYAPDLLQALNVPLAEPCTREYWRIMDGGDRSNPLTFMAARLLLGMEGKVCEHRTIPLLPEWELWRPEIVPEAFVALVQAERQRQRSARLRRDARGQGERS